MAIHTLAAAANELYHAIGRMKGAPGIVRTFQKGLKTKREIDLLRYPQNFGKHANTDPEATLRLQPEHAELLMLDAVTIHERLFRSRTALMLCFFARLCFERPVLLDEINKGRRKRGSEDFDIDKVDNRNREEFLREELPLATAAIAGGRDRPFHDAPPA